MRRTYFRWGISAVVVIALISFTYSYVHISPEDIRNGILAFGWLAPVVYIIIFTLRALILFPASIVTLAGGLAFGPVWGTVYTVIGATLSAMLSFTVVRTIGQKSRNKQRGDKYEKVQLQIEKYGLEYIFILRVIPIMNFDLVSYVAGLSQISKPAFIWGTFLGIIPSSFAYVYLGSSFAEGGFREIMIALLVCIILLIIPLTLRQALKRKYKLDENRPNVSTK